MPMHQLFVLLAVLLFGLAALAAIPRPGFGSWSLVLGWAGACSFTISTIVS